MSPEYPLVRKSPASAEAMAESAIKRPRIKQDVSSRGITPKVRRS
jgi:hypothetical protein